MSAITVYGIPGSPFLRSVEVALKEKDVPYHLHAIPPGEIKSQEHLKRHPFGRIPAFEHDGLTLYETQAIIRYLDETFINPQFTPGNPIDRARMNQVIGIIDCYYFPKAAAPIAFNRIIGPRLLGMAGDEAAVAEAMPMARICFAEFDRLLSGRSYFGGDHVSIADIMLAAQLDLFGECDEGRELIGGTTNVTAWLDRMLARPSFAATQPPQMLREAA